MKSHVWPYIRFNSKTVQVRLSVKSFLWIHVERGTSWLCTSSHTIQVWLWVSKLNERWQVVNEYLPMTETNTSRFPITANESIKVNRIIHANSIQKRMDTPNRQRKRFYLSRYIYRILFNGWMMQVNDSNQANGHTTVASPYDSLQGHILAKLFWSTKWST